MQEKTHFYKANDMVFLPPQICLQVSSPALSADPGGLQLRGKHCHLLGLLRMFADPACQIQPHALNVCQHLSPLELAFLVAPGKNYSAGQNIEKSLRL